MTLTFWYYFSSLWLRNIQQACDQEYINRPISDSLVPASTIYSRIYWDYLQIYFVVKYVFNYIRKAPRRRGNEKTMWGRGESGWLSRCKLSIPQTQQTYHWAGVEAGGIEIIHFPPSSWEKVNCNFLRSVLLRSNEAFKLVDGVKLIFKIITGLLGSKDTTITVALRVSLSPLLNSRTFPWCSVT